MSNVIGYVNFDNNAIKGNSADAKHKDWVEILSITQQLQRNINPTSKPKDALSKSQVQVGSLDMVKNADESSPELIAAACEGRVFSTVVVDLVRVSSGGNEVFYQIELEDAYITYYTFSGQGAGSIETLDQFSMCFNKINWSYKKKDEKGNPQGSVDTGWDLGANKKI